MWHILQITEKKLKYILYILGFLCFDNPNLNIPGNAGIKDQLLALKWIKENIHNFNGDPENITVFGESAGAVSAHMLMLSPQAEGLFHKAILQSGSALCPWGFTNKHDWGYKLACYLGYKGSNDDEAVYKYLMACKSRNLTIKPRDLLTDKDILETNAFCSFVPVAEPYETKDCIISKSPKELLSTAWGNAIPVIIGGNSAEGLFYYHYLKEYEELYRNPENLQHLLPDEIKLELTGTETHKMLEKLKQEYFNDMDPNIKENFLSYLDAMGHKHFWHPMYRAIKARSAYAKNAATYCYFFNFVTSKGNLSRVFLCSDPNAIGAGHGDEVCYLFRNAISKTLLSSQTELDCRSQMIGIWCNFALLSTPNCYKTSAITWDRVNADSNDVKCLVISDKVAMNTLPIQRQMQCWSDFYTNETLI